METAILVFSGFGVLAILASLYWIVMFVVRMVRKIDFHSDEIDYLRDTIDSMRRTRWETIDSIDSRIDNLESAVANLAVKTVKK
jgi:hypothetical protein